MRLGLLSVLACSALGCVSVALSGAPDLGGVATARCAPIAASRPLPERASPPPAPPACPDATSLRARAGALLREGRLDRAARVLASHARRCPAEAAISADLLASARATLDRLLGDPEELRARADAAQQQGDRVTARALRDAVLVSIERAEGASAIVEPSPLAGALGGDGAPAGSRGIDHRDLEVRGREVNEGIKLLRFSSDGERLVAAGLRRFTSVWSLRTGALLRGVVPSSGPGLMEPWILALSADGSLAANRHKDTLELWSTEDGTLVRGLSGHEKASQFSEEIDSAAFSNSGLYVATGDELGTVRVFRIADGARVADFDAQQSRLVALAWSPGDRFLASTSRDEPAVRVRDATTGHTISVLRTDEDELSHLLWSADGRAVVTADLFNEVRVWDLGTCRTSVMTEWPPCHRFEDGSCGGLAIYGLAVSPSGDRVFGVFDEDGVVVWDASTGRRREWWRLPLGDRAWAGEVSRDGRLFVVGSLAGIQLFRLAAGALSPLVSLTVLTRGGGEDAYVLDTEGGPSQVWPRPTGYYDAFGSGEHALQCRVGKRVLPMAMCAPRLRVRGLLAKRAAGIAIEPDEADD